MVAKGTTSATVRTILFQTYTSTALHECNRGTLSGIQAQFPASASCFVRVLV